MARKSLGNNNILFHKGALVKLEMCWREIKTHFRECFFLALP
jgi:hypothetical protein